MKTLKYLWHKHRLLLVGFSIATLITLVFLTKLTISVVYWSNHQDTTIETWMPIGYIARSYDVDRDWLASQTGLPAGEVQPRLSIKKAAAQAGVSYDEMRIRLLTAIEEHRAQ
jgi:hypothetical protein